ncbi:MAG: hypothetical protein K2G88_00430, partial [Oscillospiraceae bacterium]|nr:hypothetical protein [Oscillospiraceae bacterium]
MKIIFTGLIVLIIVILHIIAFFFIIKKFLQIDKVSVKKSSKNNKSLDSNKEATFIILNYIIGYVTFFLTFYMASTGVLLIASHQIFDIPTPYSNHSLFGGNRTIYICNFIKG